MEGVEIKEQLEFLKGKCDEVQGYYYKPMAIYKIEKPLKEVYTKPSR